MSENEAIVTLLRGLLHSAFEAEARVEHLKRLTGGASRETWAFDAVLPDGQRHELVLRRDFPDGTTPTTGALDAENDGLTRAGEFALMRLVHAAGVSVPWPVCAPEGPDEDVTCFVMERVAGEGLPHQLLRHDRYATARNGLAAELGAQLARVHRLPIDTLPPMPHLTPKHEIELEQRACALAPPARPIFEYALHWLRKHVDVLQPRATLVHGDFRHGNFLVNEDGLRAILDWEYARVGDPMADLAFCCLRPWRYGRTHLPVGGFGTREQFFTAYEEAGGCQIDPVQVHFWEVLMNLRWGANCALRAQAHTRGLQRSLELVAIGRRVPETEYDILQLIEGA